LTRLSDTKTPSPGAANEGHKALHRSEDLHQRSGQKMNQTLPAPTLGASRGESMNVPACPKVVNGGKVAVRFAKVADFGRGKGQKKSVNR